jgi:hypothetical protein
MPYLYTKSALPELPGLFYSSATAYFEFQREPHFLTSSGGHNLRIGQQSKSEGNDDIGI